MKWTAAALTITVAVIILCLALPSFCAADNNLPPDTIIKTDRTVDKLPKSESNLANSSSAPLVITRPSDDSGASTVITQPSDDSADLKLPVKDAKTYTLEAVALFDAYMPRGVAVTKDDGE